jgi:hypothetical protein
LLGQRFDHRGEEPRRFLGKLVDRQTLVRLGLGDVWVVLMQPCEPVGVVPGVELGG